MSAARPILYSFRRCPYAMRARMAIAAAGIDCELREVVLRDKPVEMLTASPKGTVPVLIASSGTVIDESLDVAKWALAQNDPEHWLTPPDGDEAGMHALIEQFDGPFKRALDRYKYPNRYEDTDPAIERAKGFDHLSQLEDRLANQPYLFGTRPCLADIATFPFIRQFANTDRDWFDAQPLPRVQDWLEGFLQSARFNAIMKKYKQWQPGDEVTLFPPAGETS